MFSLLSGCFEFMLRKEELHVLIVGLDKAGKTTLLERLKTLYTDVPGLEAGQVVPTGERGGRRGCPPVPAGLLPCIGPIGPACHDPASGERCPL